MWAYRLTAWGRPPEAVDVAVPTPGPGEVLVRVAGCGLCHSDITMAQMPAEIGEALGWSMPFTLGHETAGRIAGLGAGVDAWAEGDAVALVSPASCGTCRWCASGRDVLCPTSTVGRGYGRDGGLAEYVVAPVRDLVPLGPLDPVLAGPLTDAGATSHHAVARVAARLGTDSTAVVIGAGGLGAFTIQLLRALSPARVVAVDPNPDRRALALELGAHDVLDGVAKGSTRALRALCDAPTTGGADAVIDLVGTDATISTGIGALAPGGSFALVGAGGGTYPRPWFGNLPRDAEVFTFQGSSIADVRAVVGLAAEGRIRCDVDRFAATEVVSAYAAMEAGTLRGRAVVVPPGA